MKKTINTLKSILLLTLILGVTIACDKDFVNIDSDIQGIKNFNASSRSFPILTYTKSVTPFSDDIGVQTNSLPSNLLGVYVDPNNAEFGTTTASITTQIVPTVFDKVFGDITDPAQRLESVKLSIPYFSRQISTDADGNSIYELDSVFGNPDATFKLSIYESKYLLRDLDPTTNFEESQAYYSNQGGLFCAQKGELLYENDDFIISPDEIRIPELDDDGMPVLDDDGMPIIKERFAPRLDVDLLNPNDDFWENILFDNEGNAVLSNSNNFTEFFRGLIFEVEQVGMDGSLVVLNFTDGDAKIVVDYTNQEEIDAIAAGESTGSFQTFLSFTFNGIRANTFKSENNTIDLNGDPANGDTNLYLKGLDGYMTVIDLFGDEETDFLSKKDKWLINEANLIFHVNESIITENEDEPSRLLLLDLKNNVPIVDFFLDGSTNTANPNNSKTLYAEALNDGKYKFRLTSHINNILLRDSTNVKLGLYVSANVNLTQNSKIQNAVPDEDDETVLSLIPTSSILQPKGTILHGNQSLTIDKRPKFEIFYTEPEN